MYPVTTEAYAERIARRWNTHGNENGNVGYVLRFDVDDTYLGQFEPQIVGGADNVEYWIPAEELTEFNANIAGVIEVVAEIRPEE